MKDILPIISPCDNKIISFSTKANVLKQLYSVVTTANMLPFFIFTVQEWQQHTNLLMEKLKKNGWLEKKLIIRSSHLLEDNQKSSKAGCFLSIKDVEGEKGIIEGIQRVIDSYTDANPQNQILIQPMLSHITSSGVAFAWDPNTGGPYLVINYDDLSSDSASVTNSTCSHHLKTVIHHYGSPIEITEHLLKVKLLIVELIDIFKTFNLDVEFAISGNELYLFQVRPIYAKCNEEKIQEHKKYIKLIEKKIEVNMTAHHYLYGEQTVYSVMSDWNPAEMIGLRPSILALSLYKRLITNTIWAQQRFDYGYRDVRGYPLLVDFCGLPYIDVRVSFNSFIPSTLDEKIARKLVSYYLDKLKSNLTLHDKIEFDIVYASYSLSLKKNLLKNCQLFFRECELKEIFESLVTLTNKIMNPSSGYWLSDLKKMKVLQQKQQEVLSSTLPIETKMFRLMQDCKYFGTLPFSGVARTAFIATEMLNSLLQNGIINDDEYDDFFSSLDCITSIMKNDFHLLPKEEFLKIYGHLRPGTYDINSFRYDETPDQYFDWDRVSSKKVNIKKSFSFTKNQERIINQQLKKDNILIDAAHLLVFIRESIKARELGKFIFTKSISDFYQLLIQYGNYFGISREDLAYLNINDILFLNQTSHDPEYILKNSIVVGKHLNKITGMINLPPVIYDPSQIWSYSIPPSLPNYVTQKNVVGYVTKNLAHSLLTKNSIIMLEKADPGYEWIFSHEIGGLITKFGGINSHMAIRAYELNIPAVVGVGETFYNKLLCAKKIKIDCFNKKIDILV